MLCIENIEKLIKDEIKFNVKACVIRPAWLKDKEIIALDAHLKVYDIYPYGYDNLPQLRRVKEIKYLIIRNKLGMYLVDTHEAHNLNAYRSRQVGIWDHFKDVNKLGEDWWIAHLDHYVKKHSRFRKHLLTAENYLTDLMYWQELGNGSNHFTEYVGNEFIVRIELVKEIIETLKEQANEGGCEIPEYTDSVAE